jgi:hypothetical protein
VEQPFSIELAPVTRVGVLPPPRVFAPVYGARLLLLDEGDPDGDGDGRPPGVRAGQTPRISITLSARRKQKPKTVLLAK